MQQLELIFEAVRRKRRGRPKGHSHEPDKNDVEWSDEEILVLMEGLLTQTRLLASTRLAEAERQVIRDWLEEPLRGYGCNPWPFSFQGVCEALGVDPWVMQQAILEQAAPGAPRTQPEKPRLRA